MSMQISSTVVTSCSTTSKTSLTFRSESIRRNNEILNKEHVWPNWVTLQGLIISLRIVFSKYQRKKFFIFFPNLVNMVFYLNRRNVLLFIKDFFILYLTMRLILTFFILIVRKSVIISSLTVFPTSIFGSWSVCSHLKFIICPYWGVRRS